MRSNLPLHSRTKTESRLNKDFWSSGPNRRPQNLATSETQILKSFDTGKELKKLKVQMDFVSQIVEKNDIIMWQKMLIDKNITF